MVAGLYSWVITDLISNEKPYRVQLQEAARAKHVDGRDDEREKARALAPGGRP